LEYFEELPEIQPESSKAWEGKLRAALEKFRQKVAARYSEGTLHRLVQNADLRTKQAAIVALSLTGALASSNPVLANLLHHEDPQLRLVAADALWSIWFRAGSDRENRELHRLVNIRDRRKKTNGLDSLIERAPQFAEAYNQRAIVYFQMEEWQKSIADCERVLQLNPFHFGAAAGMGRSYMELGKHKAALKAFRNAYRINPGLQEVEEAIRALENALGEEGRREDKK
jgi:tetratricopeptide (TPR) repeat protein